MADIIKQLEQEEIARLGKNIPDFAPGDTVVVGVNVVEGTRKRVQAYEGCCDFYLFDTKGQQYGGTGKTFDGSVLKKYTGSTPFFLSGGIDLEHAGQIKTLSLPALKGIDINSRFETGPALKDVGKVAAFFKSLNLP